MIWEMQRLASFHSSQQLAGASFFTCFWWLCLLATVFAAASDVHWRACLGPSPSHVIIACLLMCSSSRSNIIFVSHPSSKFTWYLPPFLFTSQLCEVGWAARE